MKRLMIVVAMVVLMGVSGTAKAGPWTDFAFGGCRGYGSSGYSGYSGYGGYGYYSDPTAQIIQATGDGISKVFAVTNDSQKWQMLTVQQRQALSQAQMNNARLRTENSRLRMGSEKVRKPQISGKFQQEKKKDKQIKELQKKSETLELENQELKKEIKELKQEMRDLQKKMDKLLQLALTRTSAEVTELSPEP